MKIKNQKSKIKTQKSKIENRKFKLCDIFLKRYEPPLGLIPWSDIESLIY
jgi:hypothetical protein